MFQTLKEDINAVRSRDPAARNTLEILVCYPGFRAVRSYRLAHKLYVCGCGLLARMLSEWTRFCTGVEIHPGAEIGKGLFIDHGAGVVIGETTVIGDDATLYQGATLGGTGKQTGKRHPTLGSHVIISAGACVLGPVNIGNGARVGAGAVVLTDVPAHSTVVGVPGHVVRRRNCDCPDCQKERCQEHGCSQAENCGLCAESAPLEHGRLPDPVFDAMIALTKRIEALESARKI